MYSSWNEMHILHLRNFKLMNEYLIGYMKNMKAFNELFAQESHKMNGQYRELFKANENVHALNVAYIELFQKLNTQRMEFFCVPSLANVQIQDK